MSQLINGIFNSLANLSIYNPELFTTREAVVHPLVKLITSSEFNQADYQTWSNSIDIARNNSLISLWQSIIASFPDEIKNRLTNQGYLKNTPMAEIVNSDQNIRSNLQPLTTVYLELSDETNLSKNIRNIFHTRQTSDVLSKQYLTKLADVVLFHHPTAVSCQIPLEIDIGNCNNLNINQNYLLNSIILPDGTSLLRIDNLWQHSTMLTTFENIFNLAQKGCCFIYQSIRTRTRNPLKVLISTMVVPRLNYSDNSSFISSTIHSLSNLRLLDSTIISNEQEQLLLNLIKNYQQLLLGSDVVRQSTIDENFRQFVQFIKSSEQFRGGEHDVSVFLEQIIGTIFLTHFAIKYYQIDNTYTPTVSSTPIPVPSVSTKLTLSITRNNTNLMELLHNKLKEQRKSEIPLITQRQHITEFNQSIIVQLDRFPTESTKNEREIEIPLIINFGQLTTEKKDSYYQLASCIIHNGSRRSSSGYYTTITNYHNQWYLIDRQNKFTLITFEQAQNQIKQGYLLFYQKQPDIYYHLPINFIGLPKPVPGPAPKPVSSPAPKPVPSQATKPDNCYNCQISQPLKRRDHFEYIKQLSNKIPYHEIQLILSDSKTFKPFELPLRTKALGIANDILKTISDEQIRRSIICQTCQILTGLINLVDNYKFEQKITSINLETNPIANLGKLLQTIKLEMHQEILITFGNLLDLTNGTPDDIQNRFLDDLLVFIQNVQNYFNDSQL